MPVFCGDSNIKYRFAQVSSNVTYEASILRTFGFLKAYSVS